MNFKYCFFVLLAAFLLTACAPKGMKEQMASSYFGIVNATYSKIYYKADENELEVSIENTTAAPMQNLVVVIRQVTSAGVDETQRSFRLLRMRTIQEIIVPLAEGGTGEVGVDYYFIPAKLGLGESNEIVDQKEFISDFVRFRVKR